MTNDTAPAATDTASNGPMPEQRATMRVEEAAKVLGIGKSAAYAAVHNGELPSIRIGRRLLVPTTALRRMLDNTTPTPGSRQGVSDGTPTTR